MVLVFNYEFFINYKDILGESHKVILYYIDFTCIVREL